MPLTKPQAEAVTGGFGLYIHWPFCAAKCPYCDFNSHVAASIDHKRWRAAYLAELRRAAAETPGRRLDTIFFGGGTPSLMAPDTVAEILAETRRLWPQDSPEITLEANPTSVEAGRFQAFYQAGVNRVSLGVQSLRDDDLKRLGRLHSAAEAMQAFALARKYFDRVSFDLIYARQDQTAAEWRAELTEALSYAVDHLSLYQLTIEPGTAFGARFDKGGLRGLPSEDLSADLYELTCEIADAAGFSAYEVSNYARPGAEARHNLIYWRAGDWVGIGPGAHGRLSLKGQRLATDTALDPAAWLKAAEAGTGEDSRRALSLDEQADEYLMMSLRLSEGTSLPRLAQLGRQIDKAKLLDLAEMKLIELDADRIRATLQGRLLLNEVLRQLMVF